MYALIYNEENLGFEYYLKLMVFLCCVPRILVQFPLDFELNVMMHIMHLYVAYASDN